VSSFRRLLKELWNCIECNSVFMVDHRV